MPVLAVPTPEGWSRAGNDHANSVYTYSPEQDGFFKVTACQLGLASGLSVGR